MFNKGILFYGLALCFVIGGAYYPYTEYNAEKETILVKTMLQGLKQLHYQPAEIDDDFSQKAFNLYLERLDPGKRWLTQEDIKALEPYKNQIDDQINRGTFEILDVAIERLEKGLAKTQKMYQNILAEPFDFSDEAEVNLDYEKKPFAKNDEQLLDYWKKSMEYEALNRIYNKQKSQDSKLKAQKDNEDGEEQEPVVTKSFDELEAEARKDILKTFNDWYDRMAKDRRSDHLSDYLNAITNIYDPHTNYFLPKDKENFDISMSGTLEGIGARLQTDGEHTKVTEVIPGGPAWKGKELEANDLIIKVGQADGDPMDVTGLRIDDVVKQIRGKKGTEVKLTIRKVDGTEDVISITRDIVQTGEAYAKSALVGVDGVVGNVGYIYLPRFYVDFQRADGRSCAKDVAKEVEKLKAQNVNGIILDLRSNGGGSLRDVVTMTGLFIEEGPIVQVKARGQDPDVLEDTDSAVQYDGKLIVLVNSFSASASEILAAALQDYRRALIIGTGPSTFGKGTVQRFFDLDRAIRGYNEIKPLGDVKLTIQKFYRVDGGSTQLKGVKPDIVIPDRYFYLELGEKDQEYPMDWSEIDPVDHQQKVHTVSNISELASTSKARVENHPTFKLVKEDALRLKKQNDDATYSLQIDEYKADRKLREDLANKFEDILKPIEGMSVTNLEEDMTRIKKDEGTEARNEEWIKNLKKDIYLEEALRIFAELK